MRIAILGGTGAQGFGIALRLAAAGHGIVIGSRNLDRAISAARELCALVPGAVCTGLENTAAAAEGDLTVLAFPASNLGPSLEGLALPLAGKLVIDVMVPLSFRSGRAELAPVEGFPSVGELVQGSLPGSRVVAAFKNVPAELLRNLEQPLEGDVLVCGDDQASRATVAGLVEGLPGLRPVDAGPMAGVRYIEAITALLVNLNRLHRARTSVAILGLPGGGRSEGGRS